MSLAKLRQQVGHLVVFSLLLLLLGCRRQVVIPPAPTSLVQAQPSPTAGSRSAQSSHGVIARSTSVATATPSVPPSPTPTREPPATTATAYTVQPGDTLLRIAAAYGTTTESLMAINGLEDADKLTVGQVLKVTMEAAHTGSSEILLPDSDLVYGPGYADFDVLAVVAETSGYLADYSEMVSGQELTGPQIVQLVATQYSVGPRVLLALLELRGEWLSNAKPTADQVAYPLGYQKGLYWEGLYLQLCQAANALNGGFYGWWYDTSWLVQTSDGVFIQYASELNAATAAVQRTVADTARDYEAWLADLAAFGAIYESLFGDPFDYAVEPLVPPYGGSPDLVLPWAEDETWYYTGGPHPGWGTVGAYSALDFVTDEEHLGCMTSRRWVTAVAPGFIAVSEDGMVLQDLDGDGDVTTGWVIMYMHIAAQGRVEVGKWVETGDKIGHPSCEGGVSNASHLHLARRLNGVWLAADDVRWPMRLSGWMPSAGDSAYEGTLARQSSMLTACECWADINAVTH